MSRILVVDDEQVVRELLVRFLPRLGHQVHTVCDGQEALAELTGQEYDLLIMDMKMPRMDGQELLACIRKFQKEIPVIVITGYVNAEVALNITSQKNMQYISKPFSLEEMQEAVQRALRC